MERYYFVNDDLNDLEQVEVELEAVGFSESQIHVLSKDDAAVARHGRLRAVHAFLRTDVIRAALNGALIGLLAAMTVLSFAHFSTATDSVGWLPFVLLAIVMLGFCTWEASFFGFQVPNIRFRRFEKVLAKGMHVFFVDIRPRQLDALQTVVGRHQRLKPAGKGKPSPYWLIGTRDRFRQFVHWAP